MYKSLTLDETIEDIAGRADEVRRKHGFLAAMGYVGGYGKYDSCWIPSTKTYDWEKFEGYMREYFEHQLMREKKQKEEEDNKK